MRIPTLIAWFFGVALLAALVIVNDPIRLAGHIAALGWWLAVIVAFHAVPIMLDARAWQSLFQRRPSFLPLAMAIWIGEGVNGLFPLPHLGEVLRARIAGRLTQPAEGVGSVVVDVTLGVSTELVFAMIGLALFSTLPHSVGALRYLVPALALVATAGFAFFFLQRAGLFVLAGRIAQRWSARARERLNIASAEALDAGVRGFYRRHGALLQAGSWRLVGWIAGAGETWLVFHAMGRPIGFTEAIIIESLGHAARTAAFFIPGGLGVQDGALLLLGTALGLGPDSGLVLALTKRFRELALGVPALLVGYVGEARHILRADHVQNSP